MLQVVKVPYSVSITMVDSANKEVTRDIDISCFSVSNIGLHELTRQRQALNSWIAERGNQQHNTTFKAWFSWEINFRPHANF